MEAAIRPQLTTFDNTPQKITFFYTARMAMFFVVLLTTIFLRQEILGASAILQIYAALSATFLISLAHSAFWEQSIRSRHFMPSLLLYDLLLTSYLVHLTGVDNSIFLFVYLFNIAFASVAYQLPGALMVSVASGLVYFFIYCANIDMEQAASWHKLAWDELLFLLSALLCGQFMDELKKQRTMLASQKENIANLERMNERLLNSVPLGIFLVDHEGYVERINETAHVLLGPIRVAENIRLKYYEILPELNGIIEAWDSMTETQKLRFKFRANPNSSPHFSLRVVPLIGRGNKGNQFVIAFQDISKLQELEEKLEFESKLAATGELAAGIAHEIRNPLASISGSIELLAGSASIREPQDQKLIKLALQEIGRLNRLITDFLEFAKPKDSTGGDFPLGELVEEVAEAMRNRAGKKIEVVNKVPAHIAVHVNRERLKQVLFNLFINSAEAATADSVNITVEGRSLAGGTVGLTVSDNGPGVPAHLAEKIFDPFFTTKSGGTGLGLPTIAQIMRAAKGSIHFDPHGPGATFRLNMPASSTMEIAGFANGDEQ